MKTLNPVAMKTLTDILEILQAVGVDCTQEITVFRGPVVGCWLAETNLGLFIFHPAIVGPGWRWGKWGPAAFQTFPQMPEA